MIAMIGISSLDENIVITRNPVRPSVFITRNQPGITWNEEYDDETDEFRDSILDTEGRKSRHKSLNHRMRFSITADMYIRSLEEDG